MPGTKEFQQRVLARTRQKQADIKLSSLDEEASQIAQKLRELPDFIVDGRLHSFRKGKSYPIANQEELIEHLAVALCVTTMEDLKESAYTSFQSLREAYRETVGDLAFCNIYDRKMIKEIEMIKKIFVSWEKKIRNKTYPMERRPPPHWRHKCEGMLVCLNFHIPQASNTDLAQHMLIILESVIGISPSALPTLNTLRLTVSKTKPDLTKPAPHPECFRMFNAIHKEQRRSFKEHSRTIKNIT